MSTATHGICRYCGCQGESCSLPNGDKCSLSDVTSVCNAPGCMRAELARVRAAGARPRSKYAGWGYGAIQIDLRKQRRARRRKRAA
jgi:hypothetical protein